MPIEVTFKNDEGPEKNIKVCFLCISQRRELCLSLRYTKNEINQTEAMKIFTNKVF